MLARIGAALDSEIVALGAGPTHLRVTGPTTLSRQHRRQDLQERRRRAAVRLAAQPRPDDAAQGRPDRGGQPAARGARAASACRPAGSTTTTTSRSSRPSELDLDHIDEEAARRTRSIIMFLGPLLHRAETLRAAVRRRLQPRHPHRRAAHDRAAPVRPARSRRPTAATTRRSTGRSSPTRPIVLTERGDTVTENALMAAALHPGTTVIRNASSNYMVQDLCFFLQQARRGRSRASAPPR